MRTVKFLDRPLDLDRDPPLHRQLSESSWPSLVGGEGRRRTTTAVVLARSMSMPSFRAYRYASSPRKRIASGEKPSQTVTSLNST